MKLKASVFGTNRRYFTHKKVGDIIVRFGVQKGPELLRLALASLEKIGRYETPEFPDELTKEREWMERLLVGEAEDLLVYAGFASSVAYRYLRKKRAH